MPLNTTSRWVALFLLWAALIPTQVSSQPQPAGTLDATFGANGWRVIDFDTLDDEAFGLAVLGDGRMLIGGDVTTRATGSGDFAVAMLTASGSPDPTFGTRGLVTLDFESSSGQGGRDLYVDAAGRIVVPGVHVDALAATRLVAAGRVDASFGGNGLATTSDSTTQGAFAGAVEPAGRIAVVGQSDLSLAVALFDAKGTRVSGFGGNGLVVTKVNGFDEAVAQEAVFTSDGKLLVAGFVGGPATNAMLVLRYNRDGTLDRSFATGAGYAVGTFGQLHEAQALAVLPDGRLLLAGLALSGNTKGYVVARHRVDGTLDTTFGSKGYRFSPLMIAANAIAIAPDGSFFVAGAFERLGRTAMAVAKHRPDGSLDTTFAGSGVAVFQSGRSHGVARQVALHGADGLILAGSILAEGGHADFAVLRVRR